MNDFTIIHLSDLHFKSDQGTVMPKYIEKIFEDIDKYKHTWNAVEVVITGDIVDRCDYGAEELVLNFFTKLKEKIENKFVNIHIVPGNHDLIRVEGLPIDPSKKEMWSRELEAENKLDEQFYQRNEDFFNLTETNYINLINKIYQLFGRKEVSSAYGIEIDEIKGKYYYFIECVTAYNSGRGGNKDKRKIRMGEFQNDILMKQYKTLQKQKKPELTFLLTHYPLNWLQSEEEELIQGCALSPDGFNVDFVLCGHTHIQDIYHLNKNYKSMMTLATGIGWGDAKGEERLSPHRYSIDIFSLDANALELYPRRSTGGGDYEEDHELYSSAQIKDMEGKLIFPLKIERSREYFLISATKQNDTRAYFFSRELIEDFHRYRAKLNQWFYDAGNYLYILRKDLYEEICSEELETVKNAITDPNKNLQLVSLKRFLLNEEIEGVQTSERTIPALLKKGKHMQKQYEKLEAYLQYLCQRMGRLLFEDEILIRKGRVHFRYKYFANNKLCYKKLCAAGFEQDTLKQDDVSEAEWGDLIKAAFEAEHTLVYSANDLVCKKKLNKEKWDNYITAIPNFPGNKFSLTNRAGIGKGKNNLERPCISFGVTIKGEKDTLLYYLDYVNIAVAVGDLIRNFLDYTYITFEKFIDQLGEERYE